MALNTYLQNILLPLIDTKHIANYIKYNEKGVVSIDLNPILKGNITNIPESIINSSNYDVIIDNNRLLFNFDNKFINSMIMTELCRNDRRKK